jgi:hypothetical protein
MALACSRRVRIAFHESSHCCIALRLGILFDHVTTVDNGEHAAHVHFPPSIRGGFSTAVTLLAGVCADEKLLEKPVAELILDGSKGDLLQAARILEGFPTPKPTLSNVLIAARELVEAEWQNIKLVARKLLDTPAGVLSYDEVRAAIAAEQARTWRSLRWDDEVRV